MSHAEDGDIIAIIGKGHEDYQEIEGVRYHFLDREVVQETVEEAAYVINLEAKYALHITVRHIVEAVSGTLLCGDADTELKHISIDSRSMRGADLFVPLIGEKSDAHRFLVQAMDNGAAAALTSGA